MNKTILTTQLKQVIAKLESDGDEHGVCDELRAVHSTTDELVDLMWAAIRRVEIANAEGDPILSAWLPDARAVLERNGAGDVLQRHGDAVLTAGEATSVEPATEAPAYALLLLEAYAKGKVNDGTDFEDLDLAFDSTCQAFPGKYEEILAGIEASTDEDGEENEDTTRASDYE